jgi:hypothetical protein
MVVAVAVVCDSVCVVAVCVKEADDERVAVDVYLLVLLLVFVRFV